MCSLHQHDLRKHCFVAERVLEIVMSGRGNPMKGQALWMTLGLTLRKESLGRNSDEAGCQSANPTWKFATPQSNISARVPEYL